MVHTRIWVLKKMLIDRIKCIVSIFSVQRKTVLIENDIGGGGMAQ